MEKLMRVARSLLLILLLSLSAAAQAEGDLEKRFNDMDTNHDGTIDKNEFRAMMDKRFMEMDTNHDGKLTKEEMLAFRHLMMKERAAQDSQQK
jgi:Ca2+-binding EF-hand superfamily protein